MVISLPMNFQFLEPFARFDRSILVCHHEAKKGENFKGKLILGALSKCDNIPLEVEKNCDIC